MPSDQDRVACRTPTPGRTGSTRIERWKYEAVRDAILRTLRSAPDGSVAFAELPARVEGELSADHRARLGSVAWYTTTVKLEMEVRGEIERLAGRGPQRLARRPPGRTPRGGQASITPQ